MYSKRGQNRVKNRDFANSNIKFLIDSLKKEYNLLGSDLIDILKEDLSKEEIEEVIIRPLLIRKLRDKKLIPVNVFNEKLSGLETIVKFLKENLNFSIKDIASLTNRSSKTIWQAYNFSRKKFPEKFIIEVSDYYVPVSIVKDRTISVLESIVSYLKDLGLTYHDIAVLLKRNDRTIWTVYNRSQKKLNANR